MKKLFVLLLAVIIIIAALGIFLNRIQSPKSEVAPNGRLEEIQINDQTLKVEIADTPDKRIQGLSNRQNLNSDSGMLFIFESADIKGFWMKDMRFPLDFIWINQGKIVQINKNVPPPAKNTADSDLVVYRSNLPVDMVLEVNAGYTDQYNIQVGHSVIFNFSK